MATSTRIATARAALVDALDTGELSGRMFYAWPGPEALHGQTEAAWIDDVPSWTSTVPNIKAGRKQRQESFTFDVVVQVHRPGGTSQAAKVTFERAVALVNVIDDKLASDVQAAGTDTQWSVLESRETVLIPDAESPGWICQIVVKVNVEARLT